MQQKIKKTWKFCFENVLYPPNNVKKMCNKVFPTQVFVQNQFCLTISCF